MVQSPGGTFKNKYETSDSSGPTLKRRRSGATIEAAEETPGSATNSSGNWQQERFEDLKIKLAQALHRISALETCTITYVEQLKAAFGAVESQRNFMAAFIPAPGSACLPSPPSLPEAPEWYTLLWARKQTEASNTLTSVSLDYC